MNSQMKKAPAVGAAQFSTRDRCLGCRGTVSLIASGGFHDEPLRGFIANDPWGENPLPYLDGARWEYVGCDNCGLAFHRRILSPIWNQIRFDRWTTAEAIAEFERIHRTARDKFERGRHFARHALQLEKLTRSLRSGNLRVLDFGCGNGEFLQQCALFGFEAVGVDRSTARQAMSLTPIFADLSDVPGDFHAITLFEVLEHLEDPRAVLEMLTKRLMPGGFLVLETPDATGVGGLRNWHEYRMVGPLDHINGFTPATLRSFGERLGYRSINPPASYVTGDTFKAAKAAAKGTLSRMLPKGTQQYFQKVIA